MHRLRLLVAGPVPAREPRRPDRTPRSWSPLLDGHPSPLNLIVLAQSSSSYRITHTYMLGGDGGWDYIVPGIIHVDGDRARASDALTLTVLANTTREFAINADLAI